MSDTPGAMGPAEIKVRKWLKTVQTRPIESMISMAREQDAALADALRQRDFEADAHREMTTVAAERTAELLRTENALNIQTARAEAAEAEVSTVNDHALHLTRELAVRMNEKEAAEARCAALTKELQRQIDACDGDCVMCDEARALLEPKDG